MLTIWKYILPTFPGPVTIDMPYDARILDVQIQHGSPVLWAVVDPKNPMYRRRFSLYETGVLISTELRGYHLGTVQLDGGACLLHCFEDPSEFEHP